MGRIISDPAVRQKIYTAMTALVPILVGYGVVSSADAAKYIALLGALGGMLTSILAAVNVAPAGRHADDGDPSNGSPDVIETIPADVPAGDTKADAAH